MGKKQSKEEKQLLRQIKKMKNGDEIQLNGYDILCIEEQFYLLIHPNEGIREKHYNEIKDWIITGEFIE